MLLFTTAKRIALSENAEHILTKDFAGNTLTGEKNYRLCLPPGIPARFIDFPEPVTINNFRLRSSI